MPMTMYNSPTLFPFESLQGYCTGQYNKKKQASCHRYYYDASVSMAIIHGEDVESVECKLRCMPQCACTVLVVRNVLYNGKASPGATIEG